MTTYQGEGQLDALGDPSRRAIIALLADGPASVGAMAAKLPISRPAVSQHLRVLEAASLVAVQPQGTRRIYDLDDAGVGQIRAFLDAFWHADLQQFADYVDQQTIPKETDRF